MYATNMKSNSPKSFFQYDKVKATTLHHVQGCWGDESSLMMLPNMTPEAVSQMASKGFQAVPQLCQAASENAAKLRSCLTDVLGSSRDAAETMQVSGT